ncbi:OmpA family protein [Rubrimonas sp.]|uniref:OmpA family protein n=1 Tax=Rubrimonas sp. TaxID=2036015 RepID=UPI002FDCBAD6
MFSIRRACLAALAALAVQGCAREMGVRPDNLEIGASARAMRESRPGGADAALLASLSRDFAQSVPTGVTFAFADASLDAAAQTALAQQAAWLLDNPKGAIRLTGHTDAVGGERANLALGQRRAEAVARFLIAQGVPGVRIAAVASRGEAEPVVPTPARERANRRVVSEIAWLGVAPRPVSEMDGARAQLVYNNYQTLRNIVRPTREASE